MGENGRMRFKGRKFRTLPRIREGDLRAEVKFTRMYDVGETFFENDSNVVWTRMEDFILFFSATVESTFVTAPIFPRSI